MPAVDSVEVTMRRFVFTTAERQLMLKRMHTALWKLYWRAEEYKPGESDFGPRVNNDARFADALRAVHHSCASPEIPAAVLGLVYDMAWTAYDNSIRLGKSEDEARRAAVIFGQMPLDKFLQVNSTGYVMDVKTLMRLSRLWLVEGRA